MFSKCLDTKTIFIINGCFTRVYVFVVNEVSIDSNIDCKDY